MTRSVSVKGLAPETVRSLKESALSLNQWREIFSIRVDSKDPQPFEFSMLGTYHIEGDSLRFALRYPLDRGRTYVATFRPSKIPGGSGTDFVWRHRDEKPRRPATVVTQITPSSGRVPENLLKFYLYFSSPMSRGEVYDRVRLLKADGQAVDQPFLKIAEELWDPTGTRLTLLIDPGRIKQGLKPRELFGPVLEAGRTYTLVINPAWLDAEGDPLGSEFRKTFRGRGCRRCPARPEDLVNQSASPFDARGHRNPVSRVARPGLDRERADAPRSGRESGRRSARHRQ